MNKISIITLLIALSVGTIQLCQARLQFILLHNLVGMKEHENQKHGDFIKRLIFELRDSIHTDLHEHLSLASPLATILDILKSFPTIITTFTKQFCWISILDFSVSLLLFAIYKPILYGLFKLTRNKNNKSVTYEHSLYGYMQRPWHYSLYYFPFLYILDFISISAHALGFEFHLKGDLPRIIRTCAQCFIAGSFVTSFKDWIVHFRSRRGAAYTETKRDIVREYAIDELSSIAIWFVFCGIALEALRLEFGYALGSIFALGGIGSASVIFALKETMENLLGGILLKLNDKFRVGDNIMVKSKDNKEQGKVLSISYLSTTLQLEDNSIVHTPNKIFSIGEIINWSRTEYRLFKTTINVPLSELKRLPTIIHSIRQGLEEMPQIERNFRDIKVVASGFDEMNILIDITVHFKASSGTNLDSWKNEVIRLIATCVHQM